MLGDGRLRDLPGGVDEYLARRRAVRAAVGGQAAGGAVAAPTDAAAARAARKELARLERQLDKVRDRETRLHDQMAAAATDHERVLALDADLRALVAERSTLEERWLELAETAEA
jgi:ATP-binding cassette subfamily F protein uup